MNKLFPNLLKYVDENVPNLDWDAIFELVELKNRLKNFNVKWDEIRGSTEKCARKGNAFTTKLQVCNHVRKSYEYCCFTRLFCPNPVLFTYFHLFLALFNLTHTFALIVRSLQPNPQLSVYNNICARPFTNKDFPTSETKNIKFCRAVLLSCIKPWNRSIGNVWQMVCLAWNRHTKAHKIWKSERPVYREYIPTTVRFCSSDSFASAPNWC